MNTNNDPNLNDTSEILQIGFSDAEIQISFELTNFDYSRSITCESNAVCVGNHDEPSKSINCYQCDKLFDNEIEGNEDWVLTNKEEKRCLIKIPKINENQRRFKIWKCKYNCGKIFTQEKYMNSHILVMHENAKTISCKICFSHLSTESRLKNHMLRHSKVKHLICLICLKKRTKELSCMRYHLLNKHSISHKHCLFREAYYQMSLKEIAVEEKNKKKLIKTMRRKMGMSRNGFQEKLIEKAKLINDKLTGLPKVNELESKKQNLQDRSYAQLHLSQSLSKKPKKIVTAENGMKLVKLPNGQFRKFTSFN